MFYCYETCLNCSQSIEGTSTDHQCTECKYNAYFQVNTSNCYYVAPIGYYFNTDTYQYHPCSENCLSCTNTMTCQKCKHGYNLLSEYTHIPTDAYCIQGCLISNSRYYFTKQTPSDSSQPEKTLHCTNFVDFCPKDHICFKKEWNECKEPTANDCELEIPSNLSYKDMFSYLSYNDNIVHYVNKKYYHHKHSHTISTYNYDEGPPFENLTRIDLGLCAKKFKLATGSSKLYIGQIDIVTNNYPINKVEYKVYDQEGKEIDMNICTQDNITMYYPLKQIEFNYIIDEFSGSSTWYSYNKTIDAYANGIDLFNAQNVFFNDMCFTHSSTNIKRTNTQEQFDIPLIDRRDYYYQNFTLCESNCVYSGIRLNTSNIICTCDTSITQNEFVSYKNNRFISNTPTSSFGVVNCASVVFSSELIGNNIGMYIMLVLLLLQIGVIVVYFLKRKILFNKFFMSKGTLIANIPFAQLYELNNNSNISGGNIITNVTLDNIKQSDDGLIGKVNNNNGIILANLNNVYLYGNNGTVTNNVNTTNNNNSHNEFNFNLYREVNETTPIGLKRRMDLNDSKQNNKQTNSSIDQVPMNKSFPNLKTKTLNNINVNNNNNNNNVNNNNNNVNNTNNNNNDNNINNYSNSNNIANNIINITNNINTNNINNNNNTNNNNNNNTNNNNVQSLVLSSINNDEDKLSHIFPPLSQNMNSQNDRTIDKMELNDAAEKDVRPFCKLYILRIKQHHPLYIMIYPPRDLYFRTLTISLFIYSLMCNFFFCALFYGQKYISYTYNYGYNYAYFLPIVFWSFLLSFICEIVLWLFILGFPDEEYMDNNEFVRKEIVQRIKIWHMVYIVLMFIISIWFTYYVIMFCGIYYNSQVYFVISGCTTVAVGMVSPFIVSLFSVLLRKLALRYRNESMFHLTRLLEGY